MTLLKFLLELQNRENRDRYLQAIRTRYLLILGVWTFVVAIYLALEMTFYTYAYSYCGRASISG